MRARAPISVDVGRLVGLVGPGAWGLFALYSAVFTTLAILGGGDFAVTPRGFLALLVVIGAAAVLAAPSETPLPLYRLIVVYTAIVISAVLIAPDLPTSGPAGFEAWHLGADTFLLFAVALRARILAAWIGMALLVGLTLGWSVLATGSIMQGVAISYTQPVSLLAGTVFSLALHTAARRITDFNTAHRRAAAAEAHRAESEARRRVELQRLREGVEPMLTAIAEGRLGGADRAEAAILEQGLHDRHSGGSLAVLPVSALAAAARRRGANVVLIDETGPREPTAQQLAEAMAWISDRLGGSAARDIVVRLTWDIDELVATVTTDEVDLQLRV